MNEKKVLSFMGKVKVAVIQCGEGWMDRLTSWEMDVPDDATDEQILAQAIAEVEEAGYNVMKDQDGGACEVLHYSDGEVVAHVTIWPIKNEDDKAEEDEDEPSI